MAEDMTMPPLPYDDTAPPKLLTSGTDRAQGLWSSQSIDSNEEQPESVDACLVNALRGSIDGSTQQQEDELPQQDDVHGRREQMQQSFPDTSLLTDVRSAVREVTAGEVLPDRLDQILERLQAEVDRDRH